MMFVVQDGTRHFWRPKKDQVSSIDPNIRPAPLIVTQKPVKSGNTRLNHAVSPRSGPSRSTQLTRQYVQTGDVEERMFETQSKPVLAVCMDVNYPTLGGMREPQRVLNDRSFTFFPVNVSDPQDSQGSDVGGYALDGNKLKWEAMHEVSKSLLRVWPYYSRKGMLIVPHLQGDHRTQHARYRLEQREKREREEEEMAKEADEEQKRFELFQKKMKEVEKGQAKSRKVSITL